MTPDTTIDQLVLADAHECYAIRSTSPTVYYLDARGTHPLVLRATIEGSITGPYDKVWTRLITLTSAEDTGIITVGRRHRWDLDPEPERPDGVVIWWISRAVTTITPVDPGDLPAGRRPRPDEASRSFTHPELDSQK
ncbi:hypothetical protein [Cellulomonas sp. P24]|uniref:hypothetical protein n=1 Tax=Cellulomonas sp. P24 TaxID=2885206 RepID=UPI00216B5677|nr:hypothetical protein [Cellulomonas sp. P24]MCR6491444.1 hypothetical protein [Cellulomonas sp. P24]